LALNLWSWRDSNPRPDKASQRLLHAYSLLRFSSTRLVQWPTHLRLISWVSSRIRSILRDYPEKSLMHGGPYQKSEAKRGTLGVALTRYKSLLIR